MPKSGLDLWGVSETRLASAASVPEVSCRRRGNLPWRGSDGWGISPLQKRWEWARFTAQVPPTAGMTRLHARPFRFPNVLSHWAGPGGFMHVFAGRRKQLLRPFCGEMNPPSSFRPDLLGLFFFFSLSGLGVQPFSATSSLRRRCRCTTRPRCSSCNLPLALGFFFVPASFDKRIDLIVVRQSLGVRWQGGP